MVTPWQCQWATCDPQVALPLLGSPACLGQLKPTASSSAENAKKKKKASCPEVGSPLLGSWNFLKISSHVHGRCWAPPPTWTQNLCNYSNKATPSRVTSCLKPNLLKTANAHISVRTADTQLAWGSQNQQPPALLKTKTSKFPPVGSPLLGSQNSLKNWRHVHGRCWAPTSRITPTWAQNICH